MHSSHIQIFNFGDSYNLIAMTDRCETLSNCRTTIPLSFLKVSNLHTIPCDFYESPREQNRMCKLFTFSQIQSHIYLLSMLKQATAKVAWLTFSTNTCMNFVCIWLYSVIMTISYLTVAWMKTSHIYMHLLKLFFSCMHIYFYRGPCRFILFH